MPRFSARSRRRLSDCDRRLFACCQAVIPHMDFSVLVGYRGKAAQQSAFAAGRSQVQWPNSRHNVYPARAVDIAPYPIDWDDLPRFYLLAGRMLQAAAERGIALRWGGDWDGDGDLAEERFRDLGHFELEE